MLYRWFSMLMLALVTLSMLPATAQAQAGERCFAETGLCISGPIRAYWERNGGLAVFGYPITVQRTETVEGRTLQVQWFERDRLEIQANGQITAGRLGARLLELDGRTWQPGASIPPGPNTGSGGRDCRLFSETGHYVCGVLRSYWERNGGLERFGFPITGEIQEIIEGRVLWVQYFERRRMEIHPEFANTPFEVLLGLLGRTVLEREKSNPTPACFDQVLPVLRDVYTRVNLGRPLGCPTLYPGMDVPGATQQMERGEMVWFGRANGPPMLTLGPRIFAITQPGPNFRTYDDRWVEGQDPEVPPITPPQANLYAPWRGFGKVWSEDPALRQAIGWAIEPRARSVRIDYQLFDSGIFLVRVRETGITYVFGNAANPSDMQIIFQ
jgi:hypothetical protein